MTTAKDTPFSFDLPLTLFENSQTPTTQQPTASNDDDAEQRTFASFLAERSRFKATQTRVEVRISVPDSDKG